MKNNLLKNLSANTIQLVINQLSGLVIFYILSSGLDKNSFGQLNLALAILLVVFNLLSLGIDHVAIRKIASGYPSHSILSLYLFHVLITGILFYGVLLTGSFFFNLQNGLYPLLLLIGLGKLMIYFSTPFKQLVSGLEQFRTLAFMLIVSNVVRGIALTVLVLLHILSLQTTIIIFIAGDILELAFCIWLFKRSTQVPVSVSYNKIAYIALLREALPQMGVALITSAMARFDWIFIGFMVSAIKLAEYSFAYKVFEMSTLPLLAIAPILLPWFTKLFKHTVTDTSNLNLLLKAEMIIAALTILLLNILWVPVIDALTAGKYGTVNVNTTFILTLCIPFLYLNNFLWTINFALGRTKMILTGFIITLIVNVGLDILLIPFFKNEGAAAAFLIASIVQGIFYLYKTQIAGFNGILLNLFVCTVCAVLSLILAKTYILNYYLSLGIAVILFFVLLFLTIQIRLADIKGIRKLLAV
ncbi:oligosaccharide flippase family protein [Mucilaginibacter sp.]|uniref:oligosaccharide flippase family protein n=1 Tax=Mucilaginibacter sp. TaxID=1882438 RepID=UPI003567DB46